MLINKSIKIMIILIIILIAVVSYLFLNPASHQVVLNDEGFRPQKLTVKVGEDVVFKTNNDSEFWPASNVHPVHTIYPEFDPKRPIPPDESWTFVFDSPGVYRYHDHLRPQYKGEIEVISQSGEMIKTDCSNEKTIACWEELMLEILKKDGIAAAFNKMTNLIETEPNFSSDCHGYSHLIGEEAFYLFEKNENFQLTPATTLCGYGFYHGFMETLLQTTGDAELARSFCEYADEQLAGQASAAATACYHGTGHGAIDGSDPSAWGDIEAMMEPGFALCDLIVSNEFQDYLCATGVYNAIEILARDQKYGLRELLDDPFAICANQPIKYREACYSNMTPAVLIKYNNNIVDAANYINQNMVDKEYPAIDGYTVNEMVTLGIFFEYIRMNIETNENYMADGIKLCRQQPPDDRLACIDGLSGGHMKYGKPGVEYIKNIEACSHKDLYADERDSCYSYFLPRLGNNYNQASVKEICLLVPEEYASKYCRY